jgi:hypothetical protein
MLPAKPAPEHIREAWSGSSWIVEVSVDGTRDGRPFQAQHLWITSLGTTPEALLRRLRDRWRRKGWPWIRHTQPQQDAYTATAATAPACWPHWAPPP